MRQIKLKDLKNLITIINELTDSPQKSWSTDKDGKMVVNIGNYHLSQAYGGVSLHRTMSEGGGIQDIFSCGHVPKRELHGRMAGFIAGLRHE